MALVRLFYLLLISCLALFAHADDTNSTVSDNADLEDKFLLSGALTGFGDFRGNLSDTSPANNSKLAWVVGTNHSISWVVTYTQAVDLLLVTRLSDGSWNNHTIMYNTTDNGTYWIVNTDMIPMNNSSPQVNPFTYFFLLRENNSGLPLLLSQNITIVNRAVTVSAPPALATVTVQGGGMASGSLTPQAASTTPAGMKLSTGAIVGIAVAATLVAALACLALAHFWCAAQRRKQDNRPVFVFEKPRQGSDST